MQKKYILLTLGGKNFHFDIDEPLDIRLRKSLKEDYLFDSKNNLILEKDTPEKSYALKQKVIKELLSRINEYDIPSHLQGKIDDLKRKTSYRDNQVVHSDEAEMASLLGEATEIYNTVTSTLEKKEVVKEQREKAEKIVKETEKLSESTQENTESFSGDTSEKLEEFHTILDAISADDAFQGAVSVEEINDAMDRVVVCDTMEEYVKEVGSAGSYDIKKAISSKNDKIVLPPETKLEEVATEIIRTFCKDDMTYHRVLNYVESKTKFNNSASDAFEKFRSDIKVHEFSSRNLNYFGDQLVTELDRICNETGISFESMLKEYFSPISSTRHNSVMDKFIRQYMKYNGDNGDTRSMLEALIVKKATYRHLVSPRYNNYLKEGYRNLNVNGNGFVNFDDLKLNDMSSSLQPSTVDHLSNSTSSVREPEPISLPRMNSGGGSDSSSFSSSSDGIASQTNAAQNVQNAALAAGAAMGAAAAMDQINRAANNATNNILQTSALEQARRNAMFGMAQDMTAMGMAPRLMGAPYLNRPIDETEEADGDEASTNMNHDYENGHDGEVGSPESSNSDIPGENSDGVSDGEGADSTAGAAPATNTNDTPMDMKSPGKSKGLADKKAMRKLKLIVIGSSVILLFAIIVFTSIFLSDEFKPKFDYYPGTCTEVTVHFEHRDEEDITLGLEEYVESMVYSYTKNLDSPKRVLYQALAVAIRTNAQKLNSCTLNVSDEVDALYDFELLEQTNERYTSIHNAVGYVEGLVMMYNNDFVDVKYDDFCFDENDGTEYTVRNPYSGPKVSSSWASEQIHNYNFTNCSCRSGVIRGTTKEDDCWIEEKYNTEKDEEGNRIPYYRYVDGGNGEGISIYASHYLSSVLGYNDDNILRFFYPEDWEYYTVSEENARDEDDGFGFGGGGFTCSAMDFFKTPLSRSEFISFVTSYLSGKNSTTARLFRDNAGLIYDLGEEIGANPEMAVIVADKEQGWNDTDFTVSCNNFYGMGVTNGNSTGTCYDSFEAGVRGILSYVKRKGNLTEFTKVYSYLGTYLANPGSWGDGGCIYLTLPEIYGPNYYRCSPSYRCSSSRGGVGCLLTTEAEKQAYIDWQSKKILKIRSTIFHLSEMDCMVSDDFGINVNVGDASKINISDRIKWLFPNGVPKTKEQLGAYLTTIRVPVVDISGNRSSLSVTVHKRLVMEINAIFEEMAEMGFPVKSAGGYNYRLMASGTGSLSHHSYGVAIDINPAENPAVYQSTNIDTSSPYYINSEVVALWKKHGFYWGGDWSSKYYDPMHFTYTNH